MKKVSVFLFLLAFAVGMVFFACSNNDNPSCIDNPELCATTTSSNSGIPGYSSEFVIPPIEDSSDSSNPPIEDSSDSSNPPVEDSSDSSEAPKSSSSRSTPVSSASISSSSSSIAASSSSKASSSSVAKSPCVEPMDGVPPGGIKSCIIVNGKCYTCNPDRGNDCNQGWIWKGGNASGDAYWYKEVSCNGSIGPEVPQPQSSSAGNSGGGGGNSSNSSGGGGSGTPSYTPTSPGNESGQTTQYWDACKPSCSWSGKGGKQSNACDISGNNIGHKDSDKSACDGGNAFTCMNQAPWKVGNVSFGFVAVNDGQCGDCYQLNFPNGEVMVVMKTNIGGINGKFDIMIPGGGVGDFDALTRQVKQSGVSNPNMGERYGGFRGACGWQGPGIANCVKQKCEEVFKNLPDLKAGCLWYVNTLGGSDASFNNPKVQYKKVECPRELTERY